MSGYKERSHRDEYKKAKDLKVVVKFEADNSPEGIQRTKQAKMIICEMILLGQKRGRPALIEEDVNEAA